MNRIVLFGSVFVGAGLAATSTLEAGSVSGVNGNLFLWLDPDDGIGIGGEIGGVDNTGAEAPLSFYKPIIGFGSGGEEITRYISGYGEHSLGKSRIDYSLTETMDGARFQIEAYNKAGFARGRGSIEPFADGVAALEITFHLDEAMAFDLTGVLTDLGYPGTFEVVLDGNRTYAQPDLLELVSGNWPKELDPDSGVPISFQPEFNLTGILAAGSHTLLVRGYEAGFAHGSAVLELRGLSTVIPTPAAAGAGLMMLAGALVRRRS